MRPTTTGTLLPRLLPLLLLTVLSACSSTEPGEPDAPCDATACAANETCNAATGRCEPLPSCTSEADCGEGAHCLDNTCSSCASNVQCMSGLSACDAKSGECTHCRDSSQCGGAFPVCGQKGCVQCATDADCPAAQPRCGAVFCVQCTADSQCPAEQRCTPGGQCQPRCASSLDCPASAPSCQSGVCLQCSDTRDCGAGQACYGGACRAARPGDVCNTAVELDLTGGSILLEADMNANGDALDRRDVLGLDEDTWYAVRVPGESLLRITLKGLGFFNEAPRPTVYSGTCGARVERVLHGFPYEVYLPHAGTYLLQLEDTSGLDWVGRYRMRLERVPTGPRPEGSSCERPRVIAPTASGTLTVKGSLTGAFSELENDCKFHGATPVITYAVEVPANAKVSIAATSLTPGLRLDVMGGADCQEPSNHVCGSDATTVRPWNQKLLRPGVREFVRVHDQATTNNTGGDFELAITTQLIPAHDTCAAPKTLVFTNGRAVVEEDTRWSTRGMQPCRGELTDLIYRLSTVGLGERSLLVRTRTLSTDPEAWAPWVSMAKACGSNAPADLVTCGEARQVEGRQEWRNDVPRLPEGEYFLHVADGSGPFHMEVELSAPFSVPANDTCAAPAPLAVPGTGQSASVNGELRGATDTLSGCSPSDGQDVVYALTLPSRGTVHVEARPLAPDLDVSVGLTDARCTPPYWDSCGSAAGPGLVETTSLKVNGTLAHAWVDGDQRTAGPFTLSARWVAPPSNDVCASAAELLTATPPAALRDNRLAFKDTTGSCDESGSAPNLYYRFTAPRNGTATVTVTPEAGFDPDVVAMGACGASTCLATGRRLGNGVVETLSFAVRQGSTYYVAVGGYSFDELGTVDIGVSVQ